MLCTYHTHFIHTTYIHTTGKSATANKNLGVYQAAMDNILQRKMSIAKHILSACTRMNEYTHTFTKPGVMDAWLWTPPHDELQDVHRSGEYVIARAFQVGTDQGLDFNLVPELVETVVEYVQLSILQQVEAMCCHVV